MYKIKQIAGKTVYYSDFLKNIEHFFTSRDLIINENSELIASYLNINFENLIHPIQAHSDNIEIIKEGKRDYPNCDALIIKQKNFAVYLNFADCTPIILYDTKNNIGAVIHAGWRGTVKKIVPKTFSRMKTIFHSSPDDIVALIGPCISFKNFETSKEIIRQLRSSVKSANGLYTNTHADLKGFNKQQLIEAGIKKIDVCPYCTIEDNDKFFSYRKEHKTTKRHSALIKL